MANFLNALFSFLVIAIAVVLVIFGDVAWMFIKRWVRIGWRRMTVWLRRRFA